MILENHLYHIVAQEDKSFRLKLLSDSVIFKVHFEGLPILPGVCIVRIATELVEKIIGKSLQLSEIRSIKFLDIISPDEILEIDYIFSEIVEKDNTIVAKGIVSDGNKTFSKFSILFSVV